MSGQDECEVCGSPLTGQHYCSNPECANSSPLPRKFHACETGDCDHQKQTECDATLKKDYPG